ncbi:putative phage tail protein [Pasteurella langaaensis DSM 22999]|uniref:Putative phage tail protein n=1 Tax=Alitibacter langaaensis DSM 22999 TaxID=1122935 RepID=A0A2U0TAB8_9PAST|nr:phage tail protein [Pasteurella langaaensis]PVX40518.1 putative phage tail protein [Pasteurella langaaensis DSM 22999]
MGGGGGGGGRTPVEAPESGRSKQLVNIVEIISEGEIQGLVDGVKSVFLDNTPIQASNDSYNFNNVDAQGRIGLQDQDIMEGFNTSEKEVAVSAQVRKAVAITRTITDSKVSRLRLTLGVQSLFSQNDQGDTNGARVDLNVIIGDQTYPVTIEGKYSSQYLRQFEYGNLPPVPFQVRVERLTEDSTSQRLQNNTIWSSYTEIIETQFTYPNTALVGIQFDSEYFGSIPNRNYEIYGIKLKIPSNYDPINRTYEGLWDGTFKVAWSNNPAWVLYDLMTNKRYGLGQRLGEFSVDKWTLYQVAQYCDQMVPDGFGGKEPRFTCNAWLVEQRKAYDVINDICSIFRAMPVWNGREFTVVMDRPTDPVWTYTNANVVNGEFSYQYSAMKARHNEIHVEYIDASDSYEKKVEVVSDDSLIRRYGLNIKKVTAFGCTSRGQAHRTGKWILETERLETKTVTFSVGAEGLMHIPGDVIRVADSDYAATNIGGRVLGINGRKVTLDREIELSGNSHFTYINAEGKHKDIRILSIENGNIAVLDSEPEDLSNYAVWSLTTQQINVQLFKCLSISEDDKGKYTIVALQHEPQKEAIVDNGAVFEPRETTLTTSGLRKVDNVSVQANSDGIELSFDAIVQNSAMVKYQIKLYRDGDFYQLYDNLTSPTITFVDLPDGDYIAEVRAKNAQGQLSDPVNKTFTVRLAVSELVTVPKMFAIELNWRNPIFANPKTAIEIWVSADNQFTNARKLVSLAYPTNSYTYSGLSLNDRFWFWGRMVDGDNAGRFTTAVEGSPSRDATAITEYLHGKITKTELGENLIESLQSDIADAVQESVSSKIESIENTLANVDSAFGKRIDTINATVNDAQAQISIATQAAANAEGRVSAMQTIKTQTLSGGRTAIAGITMGTLGDEDNIESSVIVMADKFGVVKDANDGNVIPMLSVVDGKVAISGDLLAEGSIQGKHIRAGETIAAPNIIGGNISGVNGTFTGTVYADRIVGDLMSSVTLNSYSPVTVHAANYNRMIVMISNYNIQRGNSSIPVSLNNRFGNSMVHTIKVNGQVILSTTQWFNTNTRSFGCHLSAGHAIYYLPAGRSATFLSETVDSEKNWMTTITTLIMYRSS